MKIVDLNILLYAVNRDADHHETVHAWWEHALRGEEPIALAWVVLLGFLRMSTHPRIFPNPLNPAQAIERVDAWLAHPNTRTIVETEEHWPILKGLLEEAGTAGNLTTDTHLASLAISSGATLASCDADFGRFPQLRWENPLQQ